MSWLIDGEALSASLAKKNVVIVDCRFSLADVALGEKLYKEGHIPGAFYFHLDRDMSGVKSEHGGRHPLPDTKCFEATLRAIGVNHDTLVIAYDDQHFAFASRLWWLLRFVGHDQVKVLNGGYQAWLKAGLPSSLEIPEATSGNIVVKPNADMVVDIETVRGIDFSKTVLIDSREEERFLGINEPIDPVAGCIDGAVNFPWQQVTSDNGFYTGNEEQLQRLQSVKDSKDIIAYCGSGVTACVNLLALAEIGREDSKLYVGSWSDWCSYL